MKDKLKFLTVMMLVSSIITYKTKLEGNKKVSNFDVNRELGYCVDQGKKTLALNFEKGKYTTITFKWNDAQKTLSISDCEGEFPGMLKKRQFRLVLVNKKGGIGLDESRPVKIVTYMGDELIEKL